MNNGDIFISYLLAFVLDAPDDIIIFFYIFDFAFEWIMQSKCYTPFTLSRTGWSFDIEGLIHAYVFISVLFYVVDSYKEFPSPYTYMHIFLVLLVNFNPIYN